MTKDEVVIESDGVGATTKIWINGAQVGTATKVEFVAEARKINQVTLTLGNAKVSIKGGAVVVPLYTPPPHVIEYVEKENEPKPEEERKQLELPLEEPK